MRGYSQGTFASDVAAVVDDLRLDLFVLAGPVLVVGGSEQSALTEADTTRYRSLLRNGTVVIIDCAGHGLTVGRDGAMFGFPRMQALVGELGIGEELIDGLLTSLYAFTGAAWEQEDDITLVTLARRSV